jgi:cell division protein FtsZ
LNITGGPDMTLYEIHEASSLIQAEAHEDANIIFGTVVDETMTDEIRITVIATGFENPSMPKANVTTLGILRRNSNLAVPTYIRNDKPVDVCGAVKTDRSEDEGKPDLEIPTFLRRQAD